MCTCQPTAILCELFLWAMQSQVHCCGRRRALRVLDHTRQRSMQLGELDFCVHHRAQSTAHIDF